MKAVESFVQDARLTRHVALALVRPDLNGIEGNPKSTLTTDLIENFWWVQ
jgi:hypothetical protein